MKRYKGQIRRSKVDMSEAVLELNPNAFTLLNYIYLGHLQDADLNNRRASKIIGLSHVTYSNAKHDLVKAGYIKIVQCGSTLYKWFVGKGAIEKNNIKYKGKEKKDRRVYANKVLGTTVGVNTEYTCSNGASGVYELDGFEQDVA